MRQDDRSFWSRQDPSRRSAWQLIDDAVRLGQRIEAAGRGSTLPITWKRRLTATCSRGRRSTRPTATSSNAGWRCCIRSFPSSRRFAPVWILYAGTGGSGPTTGGVTSTTFASMRGFLPPAALQQRTLFDDVVRPLVQEPGTTALFLIDAFRFEKGEELYAATSDSQATTSDLQAARRIARRSPKWA